MLAFFMRVLIKANRHISIRESRRKSIESDVSSRCAQ